MNELLKNRVSGIMRVKNDGMFIERCIESCISALDELIVVYNDCTDNSAEEIEKMRAKYPEKIKCYEYPYKVLGVGLTQEEYDIAKSLPDDSPNLLCTYCNFALSKVTSQYALKIDADQVYFTNTLKYWCDFVRHCKPQRISLPVIVGKGVCVYFKLYRILSMKFKKVLPLIPSWFLGIFYPAYIAYAKYTFSRGKACFSMSGINILESVPSMIPMGHKIEKLVSGIPFNGEGDTVMFKVQKETFFSKMPDYTNGTFNLSIIEQFNHPYQVMYIGFFWKHLRVMRPSSYSNAMELIKIDPSSYIDINEFKKLKYREIIEKSSPEIFKLFQKILFCFIYKANKQRLYKALQNVHACNVSVL